MSNCTPWGAADSRDQSTSSDFSVVSLESRVLLSAAVDDGSMWGDASLYTADSYSMWFGSMYFEELDAPTDLTVTDVSSSSVLLSWTNNAPTAVGVTVYQQNGTRWQSVGDVAPDQSSFVVENLWAGTSYTFAVAAWNWETASAYSNAATAATLNTPPTNLTVTGVTTTQVSLTWESSPWAIGYRIERSIDGVEWATVGEIAGSLTAFDDTDVASGTLYHYRVLALNYDMKPSQPSEVVLAMTQSDVTAPTLAVPQNLQAVSGVRRPIEVSWTGTDNATGYIVERSTDGMNWIPIVTTDADRTRIMDPHVKEPTMYHYRVLAVYESGISEPSSTVSIQAGKAQVASHSMASPGFATARRMAAEFSLEPIKLPEMVDDLVKGKSTAKGLLKLSA